LQEGHQHAALAQLLHLGRSRLLHLDHHVGRSVERPGIARDARSSLLEGGVGVERGVTRPRFDENLRPALHQGRHRIRRQCDTPFARRTFSWDRYLHLGPPSLGGRRYSNGPQSLIADVERLPAGRPRAARLLDGR
jgi:hypothetical protein